jgi:ABC-2 type transport system permease protein
VALPVADKLTRGRRARTALRGGTWRTYRVELAKIAAQMPARVAAVVCLVGPFVFVAALRLQSAVPADTLFGRWVHTSGFAVPLVVLGFTGSWGFPVLASLVAGDLFAGEDRHDTWKTILTRSCSRGQIFAGKVFAAATCLVAVVTLLAASSLAAGVALVGTQSLVGLSGTLISPWHAAGLVAAAWGTSLAPALGFAAIAIAFSVLTRSTIAGVLGPPVVGLLMQLLALVGNGEIGHALLLGTAFDGWHGLFASPAYHRPLEIELEVSVVYAIVCVLASWYAFARRDFAGFVGPRRSRTAVAVRSTVAVALASAAIVFVEGFGPPAITAHRLQSSIVPTFQRLVAYQQKLLGHTVPEHATIKVFSTCHRTTTTSSRGAGDDWVCGLDLVALNLRQLPLNYDVTVRPNGCYTAQGPPNTIGRLELRTPDGKRVVNPLFEFDGCFDAA